MKIKKQQPTSKVFLFDLKKDSEKAYLVKRGKGYYWIPKSQIIHESKLVTQKVSIEGEVYEAFRLQVELPIWLIDKNNGYRKSK